MPNDYMIRTLGEPHHRHMLTIGEPKALKMPQSHTSNVGLKSHTLQLDPSVILPLFLNIRLCFEISLSLFIRLFSNCPLHQLFFDQNTLNYFSPTIINVCLFLSLMRIGELTSSVLKLKLHYYYFLSIH